ncbi:MAG: hypothetical protein JSS04_22385 [Proteobacteria bacterium]|nr:hypothetical protein [Pseudomonadota bacterium]
MIDRVAIRTIVAMRSAVALSLSLALIVSACNSYPSYQDPYLAGKIDRQRVQRDNCLLAHTPQLDNGSSDVVAVARAVAAACTDETEKLLALTVPFADEKAREGFQQEAVRRAGDIVLSFRRVGTRPTQ